jgi:hypothetical protein
VSSCGYFHGKTISSKIPDVSKKWESSVKVQIPENRNVYKLVVELRGEVTSDFTINGKYFKSGIVNFNLYEGEYYGSDYSLNYKPVSETSQGELNVNLTFYYN